MEDINAPGNQKVAPHYKKYFSLSSLLLLLILIAATLIRFRRLTKQSLWFDEIQTMLDAAPGLTWEQFFTSMRYGEGVHPPLFFILERFFVSAFGYSDWSGRAVAAIGGVASIWAIFLLGKEIKNKKLGLTAAALMCVNYFNIYFSQEARMYSFVCLLTTLSYLYFFRVCKYLRSRDAVLFVITSSCLIYTHYFGFMVIASELVLTLFFLIQEEKSKRGRLLKMLFISNLIVALSYIPWVHFLLFASNMTSYWVAPIKWNFFVGIFNDFFGNYSLLGWIFIAFLVIYLIRSLLNFKGFKNLKANPINLGFIFVLVSIIVSLGIPYIKSVLEVPIITSRYSIIILPSVIIAFAYGIEIIPNKFIRYLTLTAILCLSVYHIIFVTKYYRTITKPQFREIAALIASDKQQYTVINETTPGQLKYYLNKYNFKGQILSGKKEDIIDSILQKSSKKYDLDTFWLASTFVDKYLSDQKQRDLDTAYIMIRDSIFSVSSWGKLYAARKTIAKTINYTYFESTQAFNDGQNIEVAIWSTAVATKPIPMQSGKYTISVTSKGTPLHGIFPHNNVFINGKNIGSFYSTDNYTDHKFIFELTQDTSVVVKIYMDNDASDEDEDRNTFIREIYIFKK